MLTCTFYCWQSERVASFFEVRDFPSVTDARAYALRLLDEHPSCTHVSVMLGDEELKILRSPGGAPAPTPTLSAEVSEALSDPPFLTLPAAVIATRTDGAVVYWNEVAERLYGWTREDAVGRSILDLTPAEETRTDAARIMQLLASGSPWRGRILLRQKGGATLEAYVANFPVGDVANGAGFVVGVSVRLDARRTVDTKFSAIAAALRERLG